MSSVSAEQLVDGAPSAVIAITAEGTVLAWSAGAERIFGIAEEHARGVPLAQLIGTGELVFAEGVLETEGTDRAGRALSLVIAIRPLDLIRWALTITDVTFLRERASQRVPVRV